MKRHSAQSPEFKKGVYRTMMKTSANAKCWTFLAVFLAAALLFTGLSTFQSKAEEPASLLDNWVTYTGHENEMGKYEEQEDGTVKISNQGSNAYIQQRMYKLPVNATDVTIEMAMYPGSDSAQWGLILQMNSATEVPPGGMECSKFGEGLRVAVRKSGDSYMYTCYGKRAASAGHNDAHNLNLQTNCNITYEYDKLNTYKVTIKNDAMDIWLNGTKIRGYTNILIPEEGKGRYVGIYSGDNNGGIIQYVKIDGKVVLGVDPDAPTTTTTDAPTTTTTATPTTTTTATPTTTTTATPTTTTTAGSSSDTLKSQSEKLMENWVTYDGYEDQLGEYTVQDDGTIKISNKGSNAYLQQRMYKLPVGDEVDMEIRMKPGAENAQWGMLLQMNAATAAPAGGDEFNKMGEGLRLQVRKTDNYLFTFRGKREANVGPDAEHNLAFVNNFGEILGDDNYDPFKFNTFRATIKNGEEFGVLKIYFNGKLVKVYDKLPILEEGKGQYVGVYNGINEGGIIQYVKINGDVVMGVDPNAQPSGDSSGSTNQPNTGDTTALPAALAVILLSLTAAAVLAKKCMKSC